MSVGHGQSSVENALSCHGRGRCRRHAGNVVMGAWRGGAVGGDKGSHHLSGGGRRAATAAAAVVAVEGTTVRQ